MFTLNDCREGHDYRCVSTDTKPTDGIKANDVVWEVDTNKFFYFDAEDQQWHETGAEA